MNFQLQREQEVICLLTFNRHLEKMRSSRSAEADEEEETVRQGDTEILSHSLLLLLPRPLHTGLDVEQTTPAAQMPHLSYPKLAGAKRMVVS